MSKRSRPSSSSSSSSSTQEPPPKKASIVAEVDPEYVREEEIDDARSIRKDARKGVKSGEAAIDFSYMGEEYDEEQQEIDEEARLKLEKQRELNEKRIFLGKKAKQIKVSAVATRAQKQVFNDKGEPMEHFSMKEELENGHFDPKTGAYVEEVDKMDPWYEEWLEKSEMEQNEGNLMAKGGQGGQEEEEEELEPLDKLIKLTISFLKPGETVLQALRRFKPPLPKTKPKGPSQPTTPAPPPNLRAFSDLTEAADACLSSGLTSIYGDSREKLVERLAALQGKPPPGSPKWEYKGLETGAPVYGPFRGPDLAAWYAEGWFQGDSVMLLHRIGTESWVRSDEVDWKALEGGGTTVSQ